MISLDAIDRRILDRLQKDGRVSNADLAEQVGLSSSPCWRRVKALEEAGVIRGYAAQVDAKSVGLSVNVFMSVSLSTQVEKALQAFERAAAARPEVMECYLMTGDSDYLLRIVVPDLEAYERFVMDFTKIAGIAQIRSSFALRTVKQGAALPLRVTKTGRCLAGARTSRSAHALPDREPPARSCSMSTQDARGLEDEDHERTWR